MPKKIEEKLYILCPTRAYLYPVNLMGPIVHPLQVKMSAAVNLLMSGAEVYEYDPATKNTVQLTLETVNKPNRFAPDGEIPVEAATPVVPVAKTGVTTPPPVVQVPKEEPKPVETPPVEEVKAEEKEEVVAPVEEAPVEETPVVEEAPVVEEPATPVETATPDDPTKVAADVELTILEDGTVDETGIDWSSYSKNVRKALRARINEINAAATQK